ncbi:helix-turn-helix domain-containing protein [Cupriavidus sp. UME77]|jgi:IclR family mhp operon transcriptional activator|uniref:IclR family transcriptional regulator domain-containing protein n=1 Tax=Cupriavidus sp. UME77 TaxID=1862321 RepID=UPI001DE8C17C|nr:helix-turn-helix domain-containing protein [Cupriavidus sp. UME77]MBB1633699.1 hypothetical protein [Cupriavidus sp. UME77]
MVVNSRDAGLEKPEVKEVRGLTRGIMLLKALNHMPGGMASTSELARACGIHRSTARRLLETLRSQGVVDLTEREGQYKVSREARLLSDGCGEEDWVIRVAGPALREAASKMVWPINLATPEGGSMVIRESTRRFSPLSHQHALLGEKLPILLSAMGRAYLAACDEDALQALLSDLEKRSASLGIGDEELHTVHEVIAETKARGYAVSTETGGARFSSVGVPVLSGKRLLGALSLVFTKGSQSQALIEEKYVVRLKELARHIGASSKSWLD